MAITAEFQTGIAHLVGRRTMTCPAQAPISVEGLLLALAAADTKVASQLVEEDGALDASLLIAIDDRVVPRGLWRDTIVDDGVTVEVHVAYIGG